jgi:phospholipase D1/2
MIQGPDAPLSQAAGRTRARWLLAVVAATIVGLALLLWRFTPLAQWVTPQRIAGEIATLQQAWWGPVAIIALYVAGGLIVFPVTLLIAATAVVFEPLEALALSFVGVLANAIATYVIGTTLMRGTVRTAFGRTVQRVDAALQGRGVIAVAVIRAIPLAPFTLVNIAMGAVGVRLRDYLFGTALGVAPGIIAVTVFGHQLREIINRPTAVNVALLVAAIGGWVALSLLLQSLVSRWNARKRQPPAL